MNFIRSSTLLVAHAPRNDLVTATASLFDASCACDGMKLHKATIAPAKAMPSLVSRLACRVIAKAVWMQAQPKSRIFFIPSPGLMIHARRPARLRMALGGPFHASQAPYGTMLAL